MLWWSSRSVTLQLSTFPGLWYPWFIIILTDSIYHSTELDVFWNYMFCAHFVTLISLEEICKLVFDNIIDHATEIKTNKQQNEIYKYNLMGFLVIRIQLRTDCKHFAISLLCSSYLCVEIQTWEKLRETVDQRVNAH